MKTQLHGHVILLTLPPKNFFCLCSCMLETAELTEVQNDGDLILLGPINPQ